jgi:hypothetical protein
MWEAIPDGWWLTSETCKFMLACLVHKDNKDISSRPTNLPPGRSRIAARKEKELAISVERGKAKMDRPVPAQETYGDVDIAIKKAKVEGMKSYASKTATDMIVTQVKLMRENAEIFKSIHGENQYNTMIANLLCQLPGVNRSAGSSAGTESLTESSTQQSSTPTGHRGMEVDIMTGMTGMPTDLNDDNSFE